LKAVITGITGFAGGFLGEHLLSSGDELFGLSHHGIWPEFAPTVLRDKVPLAAWDVSQPAPVEIRRQLEDFAPQWLFHLAAMSVPADCGKQQATRRATAVNVTGVANLIELVRSLSHPPRIIFASTSHVYAPVTPQAFRLSEDSLVRPRNGYGLSKWAAERLLQSAASECSLETIIARAFQHAGPRQSNRLMLPSWAYQFCRPTAGAVHVHGLNTWIDLTDVRDIARAYRLLALRASPGEIFNLGSGISRRTGDILDLLQHLAGESRPVVELHPTTKQDPIANIDRLAARTGWSPQILLEQTVTDTLDFCRLHPLS
jgi:GDP-4-dehydro-6-deoxy-D-mannose reductase